MIIGYCYHLKSISLSSITISFYLLFQSKLQLELSSASSKLSKLESDVAKYQKIESDLNEKLEEAQKESKIQIDLMNAAQEKMNGKHHSYFFKCT